MNINPGFFICVMHAGQKNNQRNQEKLNKQKSSPVAVEAKKAPAEKTTTSYQQERKSSIPTYDRAHASDTFGFILAIIAIIIATIVLCIKLPPMIKTAVETRQELSSNIVIEEQE